MYVSTRLNVYEGWICRRGLYCFAGGEYGVLFLSSLQLAFHRGELRLFAGGWKLPILFGEEMHLTLDVARLCD